MAQPTSPPPSTELRARGGHFFDEGSGDRLVHHQYSDPLDLVWLAAARELSIEVVRSSEVFASWDGAGRLTISDASGFDPDDSLAQLVFHELCHALVQGPAHWQSRDWGMENIDDRDTPAEFAAQRVQAALADPHGLRHFLAVTTKWRSFYDALPHDPLTGSASDPSVALAQAGFARARQGRWHAALERALSTTATIARAVAHAAPPASLWSQGPRC